MNEPTQKITREELYERVWTTTLTALAREWGTTYVELVRLCHVLNVPRPPSTHWTFLRLGRPVEQIPLPAAGPDTPTEATIEGKKAAVLTRASEVGKTDTHEAPDGNGAQEDVPASESSGHQEQKPEGKARPVPPGRVTYSRKQLYDAIWSTPCQVLAKNLGISDVALAKTCRRLGVPRPSRGYWARVTAGQQSENYHSLKGWEDLAVDLELPAVETELHPLAQKHKAALEKLKPGDDGFVRLDKKDLFQCDVAPGSVAKLCRALHALIGELEARGYKFRASSEEYRNLQIVKGEGSVGIQCEEVKEHLEREPTEADKRKPSWTWQLKETRATSRLSFQVRALGLRGRKEWTETENKPIEEVLGIVVEKVDGVFAGFEEDRRREEEEAKRREEEAKLSALRAAEAEKRRAEEEKRQQELEKLKRHAAKLKEIEGKRRQNLVAAARQWAEGQKVAAFVDVCEVLWRKTGQGELSKAQSEWLKWARTEFLLLNPFSKGYPNPDEDGAFDGSKVPVGGPYPTCKPLEEEKPAEANAPEVKAPPAPPDPPSWQGYCPPWFWKSRR
jgi:hypothetical protein